MPHVSLKHGVPSDGYATLIVASSTMPTYLKLPNPREFFLAKLRDKVQNKQLCIQPLLKKVPPSAASC